MWQNNAITKNKQQVNSTSTSTVPGQKIYLAMFHGLNYLCHTRKLQIELNSMGANAYGKHVALVKSSKGIFSVVKQQMKLTHLANQPPKILSNLGRTLKKITLWVQILT